MTVGDDPLQRFKVWWSLYENGPHTREDAVENRVYTKPSKNRKHLDWLLDHGYVGRTTTDVLLPLCPPKIVDLHAVGLKLRDWQTALGQADRANQADIDDLDEQLKGPRYRDRWEYADYRWVALDAGTIDRMLEHAEAFREYGGGLLAVTEGGSVIKHVDAAHELRERYTRDRAYIESQVWARIDVSEWVPE